MKARTKNTAPVQVKVSLITDDASVYTVYITVNNDFQQIEIPLDSLKPAPFILLPRPYPGFQPFWFKPGNVKPFDLRQAEKLEITIGNGLAPEDAKKPYTLEVESVWLEKAK